MEKDKAVQALIFDLRASDGRIPYSTDIKLHIPSKQNTERFIYDIQSLLFPLIFPSPYGEENIALRVIEFLYEVAGNDIILPSFSKIRQQLISDASAIYEGDPAASSTEEIILAYPGFFATLVYRISHELYLRGVQIIPRLMSEIAHEKTGIDIHPGAKIGERFCIDHGTGVVIGETAEIGNRVKIYQGVTIGAKSFQTDCDGKLVRGGKRHPTIGNDCIIYANATILGGDTKIGDGCIIGGNVWLTHSVEAGQKVYYK